MEFDPDGIFEDRRSLVAYPEKKLGDFESLRSEGKWDILDTGALEIWTVRNDLTFDRLNLEIRWKDGQFQQFWRPGDRDYQNLGGALRSLDRYGGDACALDGVHPAGMESPDSICSTWVAWNQDEVDPLYAELHPAAPEGKGTGAWIRDAQAWRSDGLNPQRSFNIYKEARKFPPGILSCSGYFVLNDTLGAVLNAEGIPMERNRPGSVDWYFFAYGNDFKKALADFRLLSGPVPMPPRRSLGILFSRWPAFTEQEVEDIASAFARNGYPLSTLVMDMEWHKEGWGHWEFDPTLLPDPRRFFARCHELGFDVILNDHPLDVREDDSHYQDYLKSAGPDVQIREREYKGRTVRMASVDICNPRQNQAFRDICHSPIWDMGLDYWWNDGSRGQMSGTLGQLVSNKSFFEDAMRHGRRGMHLARYGGLGSHRYGAFFTGDANSDYDVLRLQCEFNIRAAGSGLSQISHDIGGFSSKPEALRPNPDGETIIDPALYLRWLQFGVFNPVLRLHSAPWAGSRRPEHYDRELGGDCRHWLRMRHSLMPYLYSSMRECHETGVPVTRGLFIEHPGDKASYRFDEYYFGSCLLIAPMLSANAERSVYLPAVPTWDGKGGWWEFETAHRTTGGSEFTRSVGLTEIPVYVKEGSILPRQDPDGPLHPGHIERLVLDVYPGSDGTAFLYEDDGVSAAYEHGDFCKSEFHLTHERDALLVSGSIAAGNPLGETRSICLDLPGAPKSVTDRAGNNLPWEPLSSGGRFRIRMPVQRSDAAWQVRIA